MTAGTPALLLWAFLGLAGLGLAAVLVAREQERVARRRRRFEGALAAHLGRAAPDEAPLTGVEVARTAISPLRRLQLLFGYDSVRADHYPIAWWLVLPLALAGARFAAGLAVPMAGRLAWLAIPVLWVVFARGFWRFFDRRRRETLFRQFPDALGMIVRSVRAGIPVSRAIRIVAEEGGPPTAAEFAHLADQVAVGVPLEAALRGMAERSGLGEYRFFATALALQAQTGGGLTETLENLADVIRKRVALKHRGHALASEARTSAGILACLPVVAFLGLWAIKPSYITVLFDDPGGQKILATAIGMLGMGMMVMRSIIRRSLA